MPSKKSILFLLPIVLLVMFSQIQCVPPCDAVPSPIIKQTNWRLIALDNSGKAPVTVSTNMAPMSAFGLGVIYNSIPDSIYGDQQNSFDCGFKPHVSSGRVTEILITCSQDFDPSHPAGVSLNDYFKQFTYNTSPNLTSYAEISTEAFNVASYPTGEVDFAMIQPPNQPGNYQFKVTLFFEYSTKSDSIYSTPVITLY